MFIVRLGIISAALLSIVQTADGHETEVQEDFQRVLAESKPRVAQIDSALTQAEYYLRMLTNNNFRAADGGAIAFGAASQLRIAAEEMTLLETSLSPHKCDPKYMYNADVEVAVWRQAWPERRTQCSRLVSTFNSLIGVLHSPDFPISEASREVVRNELTKSIGPTYEELTEKNWSDDLRSSGWNAGETDLAISALNPPPAASAASSHQGSNRSPENTGAVYLGVGMGLVCLILRIVYLKGAKAAAHAPLPDDVLDPVAPL